MARLKYQAGKVWIDGWEFDASLVSEVEPSFRIPTGCVRLQFDPNGKCFWETSGNRYALSKDDRRFLLCLEKLPNIMTLDRHRKEAAKHMAAVRNPR